MRIKTRALIGLAVLTGILSGCGSTIPEMTQTQESQIVEYAAGLLLKYDKNYQSKLLSEEELAQQETDALAAAELQAKQEEEEQTKEAAGPAPTADTVVIDNTEPVAEAAPVTIEEFFNLQNVQIQYTGFTTADFYPEESTEDLFFSMNATENNKLLVLKFNASNTGTVEANIDMITAGAKFKISINGANAQNALLTMLLNDLSNYQGTIAPGDTQELVLIIEIPAEQAESVESLSLTMKNVETNATISLEQ